MPMSDELIQLVYRSDQAKEDICTADRQHNPLVADAGPGHCSCNIGIAFQASNDFSYIIDREIRSNSGRITTTPNLYYN